MRCAFQALIPCRRLMPPPRALMRAFFDAMLAALLQHHHRITGRSPRAATIMMRDADLLLRDAAAYHVTARLCATLPRAIRDAQHPSPRLLSRCFMLMRATIASMMSHTDEIMMRATLIEFMPQQSRRRHIHIQTPRGAPRRALHKINDQRREINTTMAPL